jgi:hypothetical protein
MTRQSIVFEGILQGWVDARVKPAHDEARNHDNRAQQSSFRGLNPLNNPLFFGDF